MLQLKLLCNVDWSGGLLVSEGDNAGDVTKKNDAGFDDCWWLEFLTKRENGKDQHEINHVIIHII